MQHSAHLNSKFMSIFSQSGETDLLIQFVQVGM